MQMYDQIQEMWKYIGALEASRIELQTMLSKYHEENKTCDRAYLTDSVTQKIRDEFYTQLREKFQSKEWVESIY